MDPIEVLLKEYETLRQEILVSMGGRNSVLSFGLATIGAVFTASIATQIGESPSVFSSIILAIVIPIICIFVLFMWLGEYQRMQRAGKFLAKLEQRINKEAKKELLSWESKLRSKRKHMKYPYNTTVLLLMIISFASHLIGAISSDMAPEFFWIIIVTGVIMHLIIYFYSISRISKLLG
jgi:hypothetical protein